MADITSIERGIARYLDAELIPKLPENGWKRFGVGVVSGLVAKRGGLLLEGLKNNPMLQTLAVVDATGGFDVALLRELAAERIPESGLQIDVPVVGSLKIYRADLDKLYGYITEGGMTY